MSAQFSTLLVPVPPYGRNKKKTPCNIHRVVRRNHTHGVIVIFEILRIRDSESAFAEISDSVIRDVPRLFAFVQETMVILLSMIIKVFFVR